MTPEEIQKALEGHIIDDTRRHSEIKATLEKIMNNHLAHLQISLTRLEERMKLVLWVMGIISTLVITALVGAQLTQLIK